MTRLCNATLRRARAGVALPTYDRSTITPGFVHLGTGAFHRAHQAVYIDDCLARGETDWGIIGASLQRSDTRDALAPQDGLYTLAVRSDEGTQLRVIGSVLDVIVAPRAQEALLRRLTDPAVRIVTLTITEKGYAADLGKGGLRADHPDVVHDLSHPRSPRSAPGFLVEAIARRRAQGHRPFTILSCDNLPQNGRTLHRVLCEFAALRDAQLASYIAAEITCPSSMVDRIVPATTDADRAAVDEALGMTDAWPVLAEPFSQWVIEDRFASGRPRLEESGVEFVERVEPFEHMKLGLLNGTHSCIAAMGRLAGYDTVSAAMADPILREFIERYWRCVIPTLALSPESAFSYTRRLLARYDNVSLHHRTAQIAADASQKLPQRILSPLRECLSRSLPCEPLIMAVAAWIRSCGGRSDRGEPLPLNDPQFEAWGSRPDQYQASADVVIDAFLGFSQVFGDDLPNNRPFRNALLGAYEAIASRGILNAIRP